VLSALLALTAFGLGFIPVLGTAVAFTFGALTGGWLLTLELTSYPFARRGLVRLHQRRRYLRAHRSVALGFGAATFVTFLVPLGAVVTMPAAVAGATMLARRIDATDGITVPARPSLEAEPPSP
jgi:CysZ protein